MAIRPIPQVTRHQNGAGARWLLHCGIQVSISINHESGFYRLGSLVGEVLVSSCNVSKDEDSGNYQGELSLQRSQL